MNVPLSKELGLFTIAEIPVTHNELCLSKIQFSKEALSNTCLVPSRFIKFAGRGIKGDIVG
jgi:hypothetical protein